MITLIPAENESPAFCILKGKLLVPVTYYLFQNVLRKINIPLLLSYLIFFLHNCFLSSNCLTEFGTRFDFLNIRKNACRNKHQNVAS
jgi:hypothetical protein